MPRDENGNEYDPHTTQGRDPVRWGRQQAEFGAFFPRAVAVVIVIGFLSWVFS